MSDASKPAQQAPRAEVEPQAAAWLQRLIHQTPQAIAIFDRQMRYIAASQRWAEICGLPRVPLAGEDHYQFFPDLPKRWKTVHAEALAGRSARSEAESWTPLTGGRHWVRWETVPWRTESGNIGGIMILAEDVTREKAAATVLREQEELTRRTLDALPAQVAVLDGEGRIIVTNQPWEEFARQNSVNGSVPAGVGTNYLDVCRRAAAGNDQSAGEALLGIAAVMTGRQAQFVMEYPCHGPQQQRWFQMTAVPMGRAGEGAVVTHLDITDRLRAENALRDTEARLQLALALSPAGIVVMDDRGTITLVNPQLARLAGYATEELVGQPLEILLPEQIRERHEGLRSCYMQRPVARRMGETPHLPLRRKDGTTIPVEIALSPKAVFKDGIQVTAIISDLSARLAADAALRESEQKLRASEQRYRGLAEQVGDGIFTADAEGRYLDANRAGCHMFGYSLEELKTKTLDDLLVAEELERLPGQIRQLEAHETVRSEWRFRRKDGTVFVGELDGRLLPDGRYLGALRDVTERRWAEERLRDSEERLRLAVEAANIGLWDWDLLTNRVYYSPKWKQQIGYRPEEIGDSVEEWRSRVHPDDPLPMLDQAHLRVAGRPGPYEAEYRLRHRDGSYRWIYVLADSLRNDAGQPVRMLGCQIDVTDRRLAEEAVRESEDRLRMAVRSGNIGLWDWDLITNKVRRTPEWKHQLGYRDDEIGDDLEAWTVRVHPEDVEPALRAAREYIAHPQGHYRAEYRIRHKDGEYRYIYAIGEVHRDRKGTPVRMLGCDVDITARRKAEEAMRQHDQRKDEFLALLGHELRNPLAAISTALHLLSTGTTAERREELDELIGRQTKLLRRLVDELLDLSRITQGQVELTKETVDLSDLLQSASAAARTSFASREQELLVRLPAGYVRFLADRVRLEQVVTNLLNNASKYTQQGGRVELSGTRDGSEVVIRCRDNGQGIKAGNLVKIFEPFTRAEPAEFGYGEPSLGIGLALVKKLVLLHGGSVCAESAGQGRGSEFTVRIPLVEPCDDAGEALPVLEVVAPDVFDVVLVEDNADVAQTLAAALEGAGHRVTVFADGASALAGLGAAHPDVILIDIGLPGMDGYELAAQLRQRDNLRGALWIALSGHARRAEAEQAGFQEYFVKPVDVKELLAFLAQRITLSPRHAEGRWRVLLVEDNAELADVTADMLRREGLEVRVAHSGQEALEAAARLAPDVTLCDWNLPDMSAQDVVQALRASPAARRTYTVILTGRGREELAAFQQRTREMGIDEVIAKPLLPDMLRDLLARLRLSRRQKEAGAGGP